MEYIVNAYYGIAVNLNVDFGAKIKHGKIRIFPTFCTNVR